MLTGSTDELILLARLLLAALFLVFGWRKLVDYRGTVDQMVSLHVPTPVAATVVSTFMELVVAFAIAIGFLTRYCAWLMAVYTIGTAFIGHRFWNATAGQRVDSMDGFFKDLSITGGFLLLVVAGPGRYSVDSFYGIAMP
jgi:putative oxidoreductase